MKTSVVIVPLVAAAFAAGVYWGPDLEPHLAPYLTAFQRLHASENQTAKEDAVRTAPPAVSVIRTSEAEFTETVAVSGSLVPRDEILVSPEVEGFRVLELMVDEGDRVKKGDVLATLVQESLDAQLAQNAAGVARAEAEISRAQTQIVEAEARLNEAKASFERAKPLKNSGYLSESTYDQRQASAATTQAQLNAAREGLRLAQAEKAQVEAQGRELAWRLSKTKVTAPADGLVSRRTARIGGMASAAADPMFRIIARSEIELDAEVLETELGKIAVGQKAYVKVAGNGEVKGTIRLVSPEVDQATRLGRVRIFLGDDPKLRIGAFARGSIDTARGRGLAVPSSAVVFDADGAFVQVVEDGRIRRRGIEPGLQAGGLVEVLSGLADGDIVVTRAGTFLSEGDAVRPVFPDAKISEAR